MIQRFVDRFMSAKPAMLAEFAANPPTSYDAIFTSVVKSIAGVNAGDVPDPGRITVIDHGDYEDIPTSSSSVDHR